MTNVFKGFGPALRFLEELSYNNDRAWFEEHKARYEDEVREPARAFVRAMAPFLARVSKEFRADDRKVGGSIMRIHKDVRFSRDKSPYKTNLGIQFRHRACGDVHAPGLYIHIQPGQSFLGAGMWRPEPEPLQALRAAIAASPSKWGAVVKAATSTGEWRPAGASLKRPPRGFAPDHPAIEELKRTDFIVDLPLKATEVRDRGLVASVARRFARVGPYLKFQCAALGVDF